MILIINSGSSSIKYKLFDDELDEIKTGKFSFAGDNIPKVIDKILVEIGNQASEITKTGYRVVHGGDIADEIMPITLPTINIIQKFSPLAPHHNPPAIEAIRYLINKLPLSQHFAAFDTAFFKDLPAVAKTYPIDQKIAEEFNIKRFGFHGISHNWMLSQIDPDNEKKIITIHLGAGCSMAAINCGKPIDTSMGFTPIEGLPMQKRSGDIDPEIVLFLTEKISEKKTRDLIENHSGLAGISGTSGDMLELLESDDEMSKLAIDVLCYRTKKYIGAYAAALGGVDVVVFSGEIGFGSSLIRKKITAGLEYLDFETKFIKPDEELAIAKKLKQPLDESSGL
ncbi:MAG: acetate kinase [Candidatus Berkelbacteria bacterium]|nr:acetate kinase [Candidatus Berkelbacteria bacterium]